MNVIGSTTPAWWIQRVAGGFRQRRHRRRVLRFYVRLEFVLRDVRDADGGFGLAFRETGVGSGLLS